MVRRGYALIEMLIVVAIIVLMAAAVLCVFATAKTRAQATSCQGRLHQVSIALTLYRSDNEGHGFSYKRKTALYMPQLGYWTPLAEYLSSPEVVWCPEPLSTSGRASNIYAYRAWSQDDQPTLFRPFEEEPSSVVVYCENHTGAERDGRSSTEPALRVGRYPFVRQDGSAGSARNDQIEVWYYGKDWRWSQSFSAPMRTLFRFPKEPWPPKPDLAG